jgi:hypothetical protein
VEMMMAYLPEHGVMKRGRFPFEIRNRFFVDVALWIDLQRN